MAQVLTEAEKMRVSEEMVAVTTGLVAAMLRSKMISKDRLAGHVRDIHRALIDITADSVAVIDEAGLSRTSSPMPARQLRPLPSADSIKQAVNQLLDSSSTVFEPAVPYQVRVPKTQSRSHLPAEPITPKLPPEIAQKPELPQEMVPSKPIQESFRLEDVPPAPGHALDKGEPRSRPVKGKPKTIESTLPPRLSSIEEAITVDYIVCLEDGRKVKNLGEHLAKIWMTPDDYREKWKLPPEYPMMAPNAIIKRADVYEVDLVTGKILLSH